MLQRAHRHFHRALRRALPPLLAVGSWACVLDAQDARGIGVGVGGDSVIKLGPYYALLIAVQDYADPDIPHLERPISDAGRLRDVLVRDYRFERGNVDVMNNPSREDVLAKLDALSERLGKDDNLLIFFAGHGQWEEKTEEGFWLAADARRARPFSWISNGDIRINIRRIKTRHTLLISDACFSGGIFLTREAFPGSVPAGLASLYALPSRKAMTSGSKEIVPDRSKFLDFMIRKLEQNESPYLPSQDLFTSVRTAVINNSPVTPQYGAIRDTGDEGGEFLFALRPNLPRVAKAAAPQRQSASTYGSAERAEEYARLLRAASNELAAGHSDSAAAFAERALSAAYVRSTMDFLAHRVLAAVAQRESDRAAVFMHQRAIVELTSRDTALREIRKEAAGAIVTLAAAEAGAATRGEWLQPARDYLDAYAKSFPDDLTLSASLAQLRASAPPERAGTAADSTSPPARPAPARDADLPFFMIREIGVCRQAFEAGDVARLEALSPGATPAERANLRVVLDATRNRDASVTVTVSDTIVSGTAAQPSSDFSMRVRWRDNFSRLHEHTAKLRATLAEGARSWELATCVVTSQKRIS